MIVIDASAVIELLLQTDVGVRVGARALDPDERMCAPDLLDIEVAQVLRRLAQLKEIEAERALAALQDYAALYIERTGHRDLLFRIWELRESMTAYDGAYVALAEALDVPLVTCDRKLARAHGHRARVELLG